MEKLIDMHIHTNYSDGQFSPDEVIKMAIQANVGVMAITDHDNIKGIKTVDRNKDFIRESGILIFNGVEVNCKTCKGSMHVLGYDFDVDNIELNKWFNKVKVDRNNSTLNTARQITSDYGIYFSDEDFNLMFNGKETIGRPDIARILIMKGISNTVQDAFDDYLNPAKEKVREKNKHALYPDCFKNIKDSGGLIVLAHPKTLLLNEDELDSLIREMKEYGLDGIEAFNSIHNMEDVRLYLELAKKYDLLVSAGSDFHGPKVKPGVELGHGRNNNVHVKKLSLVEELKRRNGI